MSIWSFLWLSLHPQDRVGTMKISKIPTVSREKVIELLNTDSWKIQLEQILHCFKTISKNENPEYYRKISLENIKIDFTERAVDLLWNIPVVEDEQTEFPWIWIHYIKKSRVDDMGVLLNQLGLDTSYVHNKKYLPKQVW